MPYFYYDWSIIVLLPGLLICLIAQARVKSTFAKYQKVAAHRGVQAQQVARQLLDEAGLQGVPIEVIGGQLSDHYDPRARVLRLSADVAQSASVASIGVAAHEVGHAIQHAQSYMPLTMRNAIYPVVNFSSHLAIPLLIFGFILELSGLVTVALALYAMVVIFQLVTLPVEYNASSRARMLLTQSGTLSGEEVAQAGKVLNAAAMTYVAATLMAMLQFLRLLLIFGNRRD